MRRTSPGAVTMVHGGLGLSQATPPSISASTGQVRPAVYTRLQHSPIRRVRAGDEE